MTAFGVTFTKFVNIDDPHEMNAFRDSWLKKDGGRLPIDIFDAYITKLVNHIHCVREAGDMVGVDAHQLKLHDQSKFSDAEFHGYAMHFHGGGAPDAFASAWLHHIHHNPHHWQYWLFADGYTPPESVVENGRVEMPEKYAREMVADWLGASRAYTGSWDMRGWLTVNVPRIQVHSNTAGLLRELLAGLGYDNIREFGTAVKR